MNYNSCYFNRTGKSDSKTSSKYFIDKIQKIQKLRDCDRAELSKCGIDVSNEAIQYHITLDQRNVSAGLLLLRDLKTLKFQDAANFFKNYPMLLEIIENVIYDTPYGTREMFQSNNIWGTPIKNVKDASYILETYLLEKYDDVMFQNVNYYNDYSMLGELTVYLNDYEGYSFPMQFRPWPFEKIEQQVGEETYSPPSRDSRKRRGVSQNSSHLKRGGKAKTRCSRRSSLCRRTLRRH